MDTLFSEQETGYSFIGEGFAIKKTKKENTVQLYKNGAFVKEQILVPAIEKRLFVVDLVEKQGVTKTKLAECLGISRQSINNWVDIYQKYGSEGLINNTKDSWKKNPKRFTGNKARDLEAERQELKQITERQELTINFDIETQQVEEKYCGPANELYNEEFDYQENRYSGNLLYLSVLISNYNFLKQLSCIVGKYLWLPYLFVIMHINKIFSTEQLKVKFRKELGQIIGLKSLANIVKIREEITALTKEKKAGESIKIFIKKQIINGLVSIWRIFLDGHFVPYTGKEKVHKAYCTQRDMMMPGQTEFFGHDSSGNIVYFDIQEGKGDIIESFKQLSQDIKPFNKDVMPLVVVDREIWGVENFIDLTEYRFVTWEKNCDKESLAKLPEEEFNLALTVNKKDYLLFEKKKTYRSATGKIIELRRIISRNTHSGETFAIVTNDKTETTETIAESMLNRWGCSENSFKHMGVRTNMHNNPKLKTDNESSFQQIANPQYIELKKSLKEKKKELTDIRKQLGKKEPKLKKDGTPRQCLDREKKIKKRMQLEQEIRQISQQISKCHERVETSQVNEKPFRSIDKEAKKWWNITETIFWNSRKQLARQLYNYLPDNRDLLPVLDAITSSRGWIKSTKDMLLVRLEPLETPRFRDAQTQLCRFLNSQKVKLPNGKLLQYDVANSPWSVK